MLNNKLSLVILLVSITIFLGGCVNNKEVRYNSCVESCKENTVCTDYVKNEGERQICSGYNMGDCINVCTQKYK